VDRGATADHRCHAATVCHAADWIGPSRGSCSAPLATAFVWFMVSGVAARVLTVASYPARSGVIGRSWATSSGLALRVDALAAR